MPEKILGIDIGSSAIKVVQVTRGFRVCQKSGYASVELAENADVSQVANTLADLISEKNLESDRYLVALGAHEAFLRRLSFPFSARRKIAQVIRFEMEPGLPMGLDEVVVDFITTESGQEGRQEVLAAAIPRTALAPLLLALREVGIEPEVVDLDGSGLTFVAQELREQLPERTVILDIGRRKTNMLYQHRGVYTYTRSLMIGCGHLAEKAAEVLGVSADEGLQLLFTIGLDEEETSSKLDSARRAISGEVESLAREVELSLMSARIQQPELWPELILLTGGGSLIKGLAKALEKILGLRVFCLSDLEDLGLLNQFEERLSDAAPFAVAAGLAFKGAGRRVGFNFQAEDIRSQNPLVKWRNQLSYGLVACAAVAFAWLGSVGVDIYTRQKTLNHLERSIEEVFRRTVPDFKGSVRSSQYPSIVKTKINELSQSVALFGAEAGHHSTVELLRVVNEAIPKDLDVTVSLLTVDSQRVRLSGRADEFNTVDGVKNGLAALEDFDKVTITGAKAAADGKGVQFGLELLRLQPTEEG